MNAKNESFRLQYLNKKVDSFVITKTGKEKDNEIDSLVSDPDKVVDIIMYVKNEAAKQDISDDQIRSLIQTAESTAGVSLSEEEENRIIKIVKQIKDSDIDEEQLRSHPNHKLHNLEW